MHLFSTLAIIVMVARYYKTKKCAAEATHRKMQSSDCCDTIQYLKKDTLMEHALLPIGKNAPQLRYY